MVVILKGSSGATRGEGRGAEGGRRPQSASRAPGERGRGRPVVRVTRHRQHGESAAVVRRAQRASRACCFASRPGTAVGSVPAQPRSVAARGARPPGWASAPARSKDVLAAHARPLELGSDIFASSTSFSAEVQQVRLPKSRAHQPAGHHSRSRARAARCTALTPLAPVCGAKPSHSTLLTGRRPVAFPRLGHTARSALPASARAGAPPRGRRVRRAGWRRGSGADCRGRTVHSRILQSAVAAVRARHFLSGIRGRPVRTLLLFRSCVLRLASRVMSARHVPHCARADS